MRLHVRGDELLVVLIHGKQIVVVTFAFGGITLQLVDHVAGCHFLVRFTQLRAGLAERGISRVGVEKYKK